MHVCSAARHAARRAALICYGTCFVTELDGELMATLPGIRLYSARGYVAGTPVTWPIDAGSTIEFVPMSKAAPGEASKRAVL